MRLLLLGATGLVGSTALKQALAERAISEVVAPTQRPFCRIWRLEWRLDVRAALEPITTVS
jgi:uncharacterized protein YbjT (DUF2867 family)